MIELSEDVIYRALDYIRCGIATNYSDNDKREELLSKYRDPIAEYLSQSAELLRAAESELSTLRAELDKLKEQKPVYWVGSTPYLTETLFKSLEPTDEDKGIWNPLYAHPVPPQQVPDLAPTDNGIPELDGVCAKYNAGEIDVCQLVCRIWNTAMSTPPSDEAK